MIVVAVVPAQSLMLRAVPCRSNPMQTSSCEVFACQPFCIPLCSSPVLNPWLVDDNIVRAALPLTVVQSGSLLLAIYSSATFPLWSPLLQYAERTVDSIISRHVEQISPVFARNAVRHSHQVIRRRRHLLHGRPLAAFPSMRGA